MIPLAIFAKTYGVDAPKELAAQLEEDKIAAVHYNMTCSGLSSLPKEIPQEKIQEIREQVLSRNIEIVGVSATFNMVHPNRAEIEKGLESLKAIAEASRQLKSNVITLCTGSKNAQDKWKWHPENSSEKTWSQFLDTLEKAIVIAEENDVILGIEPETANVVNSSAKAKILLADLQSDRVKIILDPANLFDSAKDKNSIREIVSKSFDLLYEDIAVAHAKDRSLDGTIRAAGKGDIDFEHFIGLLHQSGFQGPLVMHGLKAEEIPFATHYLNTQLDAILRS